MATRIPERPTLGAPALPERPGADEGARAASAEVTPVPSRVDLVEAPRRDAAQPHLAPRSAIEPSALASALDKVRDGEGVLRAGIERLGAELRRLEADNAARVDKLAALTEALETQARRIDDVAFAKTLAGTTLTVLTGGLLPVGLALLSGRSDAKRIGAIEAELRAVRADKALIDRRITEHQRIRDALGAKLEQLRAKDAASGTGSAETRLGGGVGARLAASELARRRVVLDDLEAQVRILEEIRDSARGVGDVLAPLVEKLEGAIQAAKEALAAARKELLAFAATAGGQSGELVSTVVKRLAADHLEPIVRSEARALLTDLVREKAQQATARWVKAEAAALPPIGPLPLPGSPPSPAFAPLDAVVGDAKVVAVGEPAHGLHDFPALRNQLFAHLIEHRGFRAVTLESGIVEARLVDRFVCDVEGKSGLALDDVLARGFTHGMGPWEETKALVTWVRAFNRRAAVRGEPLVHFVGKDLPREGDTLTVPLREVYRFLEASGYVHGEATRDLFALAERSAHVTTRTLEIMAANGFLPVIDPDLLDAVTSVSYEQLSPAEREALAAGLAALRVDLLTNAEHHVAGYQAATSSPRATAEAEHQGALDMVRVTEQLLEDLERRVLHPADTFTDAATELLTRAFTAAGEPVPAVNPAKRARLDDPDAVREFFVGRSSRERHLAENVLTAASRHGKVLSFAHNGHVNRAAMGTFVGDRHVQDFAEGEFLARALGKDYVVLGATTGRYVDADGRALTAVHGVELPTLGPGTLESVFAGAEGAKLVDLRRAPEGLVHDWLHAEQRMRHQWSLQPTIPAVFDAMIYLPDARPAVSA